MACTMCECWVLNTLCSLSAFFNVTLLLLQACWTPQACRANTLWCILKRQQGRMLKASVLALEQDFQSLMSKPHLMLLGELR